MSAAVWTQADAIALCCEIEAIAPAFGLHVALTGGLLYKQGPRKDADILLYRIRQMSADWDGLWDALDDIGVTFLQDYGWCKKAAYQGKPIDFFDPDADGDYGDEGNDIAMLDLGDFA
jgi:hypothetical protein